jgi:DNA polymerase III subunit epsilon
MQQVDLSSFQLAILDATEAEREAHGAVLAELDKASGGKTLWRNLVA